ncbi:gamma-glutamyltranspeptidase / glutathione hydrolase [Kushneria avicenniae]|uniref:Glutathione hydrolase proenzyme n=1 Tax=Kushneria avicenniae TaxID=402385 RepID=A0A1I1MIG9_9GAMM|nr:gamma-glutamyltransferase [Kushneria avicenniae]SFC82928.1 gamma-glutamyltranspeptidase / glutathione hydrolase [Kushneria avicenniae]
MPRKKRITLTCLLVTLISPLAAAQPPIIEGERFHAEPGQHAMVVTSHELASRVGRDILREGGNAVDAAVAIGFALAVVQPRSGNIGGGGFMVISDEKSGDVTSIDYRETAPAGAFKTMFQDDEGNVIEKASRYSANASGVPGTVAGMAMALDRYGAMSLDRVMAPAIRLARDGFAIPQRFADGLNESREQLEKNDGTRRLFYKGDGSDWHAGEVFKQPELAATLTRIARNGPREFYEGETAGHLIDTIRAHEGIMTLEDLKNYRAVERAPIHGTYRDYDIYAMAPPSSGGIHIVQILNMLENDDLTSMGFGSAATMHLMSEAMRRAYADRSKYLGDPAFFDVPARALTSKDYARTLRAQISPDRATPSDSIGPGNLTPHESNETTHYSVADDSGLAVANTYTLNFSYGSGIAVDGAGFLLNNEMDDFSAKPGVPNAYGLVGGEANAVAPGKRMLSSMTPTIVKHNGKNFLVTGSPGGSRIITTTLGVITNVIDHGMNVQSAVSAPRFHDQWLPDELRIEDGFSPDTLHLLEGMGHHVIQQSAMGASQSILINDDGFQGGADPRRETSSAMGL